MSFSRYLAFFMRTMSSSSESRLAVIFLATAGWPPSNFRFLYVGPDSGLEELALVLGLGD
jgi:hypothetical protein